eukprot:CAMPEP_0172370080 /NCGR_PEP_ID=MMETSP1060-20121228/36127_1 /TAXON_ID=37318 /ORGANISM="Pseudo-nitzschia pungens, Strain cf. cingulata" /LENGTH=323 /DNA_ID=CAMNT_0013095239 /DNA_START=81 /DNA_END=1052 /DNA_ORIENTATION=-
MDSNKEINLPRDDTGNFVRHVPGLEYYRNFLSPQEQSELLDLLNSNPWQEGVIARRQQFYGEVYYHTSFKSKFLQGSSGDHNEEDKSGREGIQTGSNGTERQDKENKNDANLFPSQNTQNNYSRGNGIPMDDSGMQKWLDKTMPFFEKEGLMEAPTQVLINEYRNNMGIASHFEDFDAFGPVIVTISLISPVYITLKKPKNQPNLDGSDNANINACDSYDDVVKILLEPGSLLIMKDDARFKYRHGIGKYKWIDLPPPQEPSQSEVSLADDSQAVPASHTTRRIKRDDSYRRVSLTIRHLKSTRRKVRDNEDESNTIKDPSAY